MLSELCFKAPRRYLQGADLVQFLLDCLASKGASDVRLMEARMERFTANQVECVLGNDIPTEPRVVVNGRASIGGKECPVWLRETGVPVECSRPYNEIDVLKTSIWNGVNKFTFVNAEFTRLEQIVATMKHFCNERYPLVDGKWVFTGLRSGPGLRNFSKIQSIEFYQGLARRLVLFKGYDEAGDVCALLEFARKGQ